MVRVGPGAIRMRSKFNHGDNAGLNRSAIPIFIYSTHLLSYNRAFRVIERSESVETRIYTDGAEVVV